MPIQYPNFPKLTSGDMGGFDLGAAIKSGLGNANLLQEAKYKPRNLQEALIAAQQKNQMNAPYAENANRVFNADVGLREAQTQAALRPKPIPGKLSNIERLRDRYPKGSEDWNTYDKALRNAIEGQNGITLYDPKGNPMVQIGGSSGTKGAGKGGQLYESSNGNQYQTPTNAISTQVQNRIIGQKLVEPYLKNIIKTLPQFQSGWTKGLSSAEGFTNKWLGTNFDLPSQLQSGKASLGLAAEGMLRQFGLNATSKNLTRMEAILTPGEDESPNGYTRRATQQLLDFIESSKSAQEISRSGVPVKEGNNEDSGNKYTYDPNNYDVPEGYVMLYKNGEQYVFPPNLVDEKLSKGYSYER